MEDKFLKKIGGQEMLHQIRGQFMERKISKTERIAIITKILVENPSKLFTLNYFSELLFCAKSTLSEDIKHIESFIKTHSQGRIYSLPGAAGGVYYIPSVDSDYVKEVKKELIEKLSSPTRIIPGGYLYMNDVMYDPIWLEKMAVCILSNYLGREIDYVVTIETKGIPLALAVARLLNKPIVVIRKAARLTEGTTIQMNYVTGSKHTIKTMALPIRSIKRGSNILFIDDFMKAGSTAKGAVDLMKEFEAKVVGVAVMMSAQKAGKKLVDEHFALINFEGIDEDTQKVYITAH